MRLSVGCPTHNIHPEAVEMHVLALDDAYHHPAQLGDVAHHATRSGIDSDNHATHHRGGKLESLFLPICVVTPELKSSSSSLLAFVSSSNTFVSQAGFWTIRPIVARLTLTPTLCSSRSHNSTPVGIIILLHQGGEHSLLFRAKFGHLTSPMRSGFNCSIAAIAL